MAAKADGGGARYSQLNAGDEYFKYCCSRCTKDGKKSEAVKYCPICKEYFCDSCLARKHNSSAMLGHALVSIGPSSAGTSQHNSKTMPSELCDKHPMEVISMFCKDHDVVECSVCFHFNHTRCPHFHYIPDFIESNFSIGLIDNAQRTLTRYERNIADCKTENDKAIKSFEDDKKACKDEIKKYRDEINSILDDLEKHTIANLEAKYHNQKKDNDERRKRIDKLQNDILKFKHDIESDQCNDAQKFVISKLCRNAFRETDNVDTEIQSMSSNAGIQRFKFDRNVQILNNLANVLTLGTVSTPNASSGYVSASIPSTTSASSNTSTMSSTKSHDGAVFSSNQNLSDGAASNFYLRGTTAMSAQGGVHVVTMAAAQNMSDATRVKQRAIAPTHNAPGSGTVARNIPQGQPSFNNHAIGATVNVVPTASQSNTPSQSSGGIAPTGAGATSAPNTAGQDLLMKVVSVSEHNVQMHDDRQTCIVWSLCVLDNGDLLLADFDNKKLKFVDGKKYTVQAALQLEAGPRSVCKINNREAVVCLGNKTIQFISIRDRRVVNSVRLKHECKCVASTSSNIFVCDSKTVHIYSLSGLPVTSIKKDQSGNKLFSDICDIVASDDGNKVHVADSKKGVCTIDDKGFEYWSSSSEFKAAHGVCTDESNSSVIACSYKTHNVVQFSVDGTLKGEILSGLSMALYPKTVCFDKKSRKLIVGRWDNSRIKVFTLR